MDANAYLLPGVDVDFDEIEYRNVGLAVLNLRAPSVLLGFQVGGIVGHDSSASTASRWTWPAASCGWRSYCMQSDT